VLLRVTAVLAGAALLIVGGLLAFAPGHTPSKAPAERPAAVVVLILDEFPVDSMLGPDGRIDAARFPNFAKLAATSTWFRNAMTVYDSTFKAVPAILDGRLPQKGTKPDLRSHSRSVYTLFDRLRYLIVDTEPATAVCGPRICPGHRTRRPGVLLRLRQGGRPPRLRRWIRAIRPRPRPTLYLQHALLPHEPWIYLPSGRRSRPVGNDPVEGINDPRGFHDADLALHNHVRYMLQLGYVDRELGVLLDQLRDKRLFDRTLLAITADHGYAFQLGLDDRRQVVPSNIDKIAPVPLFVKRPGQRAGRVSSVYVQNIDIVPTLADLLGTRLDWRVDGRSLFALRARPRAVGMVARDFTHTVTIDVRDLESRRQAQREHWAKVFLTGAESKARYGSPWASVYLLGPNAELIGRRARAAAAVAGGGARIANAHLWRRVRPSAAIVPTRVAGELFGGRPGVRRDLAAAVNGRIRAVGRSFFLKGDESEWFSLIVPEESIRPGRNRVELLQVLSGGRLRRLASAP
jgi:hypothetical protein